MWLKSLKVTKPKPFLGHFFVKKNYFSFLIMNHDVVRPEVYWKDGRCYRKNPSRNNYQLSSHDDEEFESAIMRPERDTTRPKLTYDELEDTRTYEDETCGLDMSDEDEDNSKYVVEQSPSGFKTQCDNISSSFYNVIIGAKGATKKRLETETNTKIIVPRINERGDIIIRGQKKKDVLSARRRMDLLCSQARFKRDLTHFVSYPLNTPEVVKKYNEFKEKILQDFGSSGVGVEESVFQVPEKMHLTLCMLVLADSRERTELTNALYNLTANVKNIVGNTVHTVGLHGLEIMNDDPSAVDVLYAKCITEDDTLQKLANFVVKQLDDTGYCKKNRTENVKLHATLMNTRWRAETLNNTGNGSRNRVQRETFDARDILEKYGDFSFGTVEIKEIKVCTRHTQAKDGSYNSLTTLSLV